MNRSTFNYILDLISLKLKRKTIGHQRISSEKQFLIAIWKMATPDSYRYVHQLYRGLNIVLLPLQFTNPYVPVDLFVKNSILAKLQR